MFQRKKDAPSHHQNVYETAFVEFDDFVEKVSQQKIPNDFIIDIKFSLFYLIYLIRLAKNVGVFFRSFLFH